MVGGPGGGACVGLCMSVCVWRIGHVQGREREKRKEKFRNEIKDEKKKRQLLDDIYRVCVFFFPFSFASVCISFSFLIVVFHSCMVLSLKGSFRMCPCVFCMCE